MIIPVVKYTEFLKLERIIPLVVAYNYGINLKI
jgi:hypothetical protein